MKRVRPAVILFMIVLLASTITVDASGDTVPTAAEAVRLALVNSSESAIARSRLEAALAGDANLRAALLGWRLDGVVDDTLTQTESLKKLPFIEDPLNTLSATLAVRKALGMGGTTKLALEESRLQTERAKREYESELRQIALTAYEAYRQLELALIQYRVLEQSVDLTRDSLSVTQEQHAAGAQSDARLEEARLAYREALQKKESAERMLDIAWLRLARLLGLDPQLSDIFGIDVLSIDDALQMIVERDPVFWPDNPFPWASTVDESVAIALENRPEILGAQDAVQLARLGVEKVKLDRRANVQFTANATWPEQIRASMTLDNDWIAQGTLSAWRFSEDVSAIQSISQAPEDDVDWDIGVKVTLNLWDSGASRAGAYRAEQAVNQAEFGLDQARHGVTLDVQSGFAEVQDAYDALWIAGERVQIALLDLETEELRATLGTSSPLQVDGATLKLWQAVIGAISARFEYEISVLKLAKAIGWDLDTIGGLVDGLQGW